jgi:hypothetical protein
MANTFGTDIIIQSEDPDSAARFYVEQLGFEITGRSENLVSIEGPNINFYIERGPKLGPVFELHVGDVAAAKARLLAQGCRVIKDEPQFPRCYIEDLHGLMYNLAP